MIISVVDDITSNIENNVRFGESVQGVFTVQWASWDNPRNRVSIVMFSVSPFPPLNGTDLNDAVNRFGIVWGVRSYEFNGEGIITIDSLRVIGEENPLSSIPDSDDDEIVR